MLAIGWKLLTAKFAGPAATALALGLAICLAVSCGNTSEARRDAEKAEARARGYAHSLETCQGNVSTLEGALRDQNAAVEDMKAEGVRIAAEAGRSYAQAQAGRAAAERRAARLLALKPTGDACADLRAVDTALLESLR